MIKTIQEDLEKSELNVLCNKLAREYLINLQAQARLFLRKKS